MTFQQKLNALMESLVKKGSREPLSEKEIGAVLKALDEAHSASISTAETASNHAAAVAALKAENKTLREAAEQAQLQASASRQEISGLRGALDELYGSTSWKASAPLRRVKNTFRSPAKTGSRLSPANTETAPTQSAAQPKAAATKPQTNAADELYVARDSRPAKAALPASLFAFYLPQFHPIAENDEWWGEGFTEWTNVKPAQPLYEGHYQPHVPDPNGALGYYDLRETSKVMGEQMSLARQYGVEGFCFYFYWFAGHRLLETPLLNLLEDKDLDVPFCLCWANENWSRRWDGRDSELLMTQDNTPEDDIAFISYISKYLKDPRYRKIDGKPLLLVYRPIELPDAKATAKRWREWCRENGVGEIYLGYTQSFENNDPRDYGFDGAVEFPPNNSAPPELTDTVTPLSDNFGGKVYDWDIFPTRSDTYAAPDYPLFRTVCPAWDNTARRKENGTVFAGSTPERYQHWLSNAVAESCARIPSRQDRLIFVNAWNEWAEGAHLEPDARYGHAYLQATRSALEGYNAAPGLAAPSTDNEEVKKIVIVSHDAYPHGAQYLALNLAKTFSEGFDYSAEMVVLGDGPMAEDFARYANVHNLAGVDPRGESARALARSFKAQGIKAAICNTTVSGHFAQTLKEAGLHVTCLIHELSSVITQYGLEPHVKTIASYADKIVFPAPLVRDNFTAISGPLGDKAVMRPQGAYKVNRHRDFSDIIEAKAKLRKTLGLNPRSKIVLGVGYADARKGFDLFLSSAETLKPSKKDIVYLWLGHQEPYIEPALQARMDKLMASGRLILPGRVEDTDLYYAASDIYLLTSREDPYPSTVLEALDVGLSVIGFDGVTGSVDLIAQSGGLIVPAFDIAALNSAVVRALITADMTSQRAVLGSFRARDDISFSGYVADLIKLPRGAAKTVSAVVPNYNYAHFLRSRIDSILGQSHPVSEIIILDDGSTDDSAKVIGEICSEINEAAQTPTRFIQNTKNSGSVFAQWLKGVEAAQSDYVWIAEADDLALPEFLKTALSGFTSSDVVMSYTQSKQMSEAGEILDDSYRAYVADICEHHWSADYARTGTDEITQGLSVKNSVPNVSGVVFRREDILHVLRTHMAHIKSFRVAGDWAAYVHLLTRGNIAFHAEPLNLHRRHDQSVTNAKFGAKELDEIIRMQRFVETEFDVSPEYKDKARAYIETLKAQFGLGHIEAAQ